MFDFESLDEALDIYHSEYRHPDLRKLHPSPRYYLVSGGYTDLPKSRKWPATWPNSDRPGVYLFFDNQSDLIYIGKAASLGSRLSSYFKYADDESCEVKDNWGEKEPDSLVTVPVSKPFEAPSLEEYLISCLNPPVNKVRTS